MVSGTLHRDLSNISIFYSNQNIIIIFYVLKDMYNHVIKCIRFKNNYYMKKKRQYFVEFICTTLKLCSFSNFYFPTKSKKQNNCYVAINDKFIFHINCGGFYGQRQLQNTKMIDTMRNS